MSTWMILPRDPLLFRDGKPFNATPGERASSLAFPFPSTTSGAARTFARTNKDGVFDSDAIPDLLKQSIRGPFLVEVDEQDRVLDWLFPAPADALLIDHGKTGDRQSTWRYRLTPKPLPPEAHTDFESFQLVSPSEFRKEKPDRNAPNFWRWSEYKTWLAAVPKDGPVNLSELGIKELPLETRFHVGIDANTRTAKSGALFQTRGLEFQVPLSQPPENEMRPSLRTRRFALIVETDLPLREDYGFLGGERRAIRWKEANTSVPNLPEEVRNHILDTGFCRLILATPAYFESGFLPEVLLSEAGGIIVHAAAVPRYQTISGWDYVSGRPKPTKRLAPAGSTYFLEFKDKNKSVRAEAIERLWLRPVSDDERNQNDGFGLALLGAWVPNKAEKERVG